MSHRMHRIAYLRSAVPLDGDRELLAKRGIDDVELFGAPTDSDGIPLPGSLQDADGIVSEWGRVDAATFAANPQLKAVGIMAIGYDFIDAEAAERQGCWVTNVPGYCTYDVALHALGLIVDLYKKISWFDRQTRSGTWDDMAGYDAERPRGKRAGLVFFGSIAQALVPMLQSIGMEVAVWAPTKSVSQIASLGCEKVDTVEELFSTSDVVSLHCPLVKKTQGLIRKETLRLMKPTAFLVNTSRGGCVVEEDLAWALRNHVIRAAAIDVIQDEVSGTSPLIGLDNCIVTPHAAYHSADSYAEMRERALMNVVAGVHGRRPADPVNEPVGRADTRAAWPVSA